MVSQRLVVIGYGNPLRGDDGLGWRAAEVVQARLPEAEVLTCHQLTPELAETLSQAARAAFVDVAVDQPPGRLQQTRLRPEAGARLGLTHQFTPTTLLGLARGLYGRAPDAVLFTVGGQSFDYTDSLSPLVEAALPELVRLISAWAEPSLIPNPHQFTTT